MIRRTASVLLILASLAAADDRRRADEAWHAGRFEDAAVLYERALERDGADAGYVHFRLGCCAFRAERWADAVHHFGCAALRRPRDERVAFNLELAARHLDAPAGSHRPRPGVEGAWMRLTAREKWWLALVLQLLGVAGVLLLRRVASVRSAAAVVLLLGIGVQIRVIHEAASDERPGVVLVQEVDVRAEPRRGAASRFSLEAGEAVVVLAASDRWARVVHPRGEGWIARAAVGVVE